MTCANSSRAHRPQRRPPPQRAEQPEAAAVILDRPISVELSALRKLTDEVNNENINRSTCHYDCLRCIEAFCKCKTINIIDIAMCRDTRRSRERLIGRDEISPEQCRSTKMSPRFFMGIELTRKRGLSVDRATCARQKNFTHDRSAVWRLWRTAVVQGTRQSVARGVSHAVWQVSRRALTLRSLRRYTIGES